MSGKMVTPKLGAKSFTCPHCGAIAHQTWYRIFPNSYDADEGPWIPDPDVIQKIKQDHEISNETKADLITSFERRLSKGIFRRALESNPYIKTELINLYVSLCYSCDKYSLWVADDLIYPAQPTSIAPNDEMPSEIRADFIEASAVVAQSPRGAAALLRLCIQKLMVHLGLKGKNIDEDIGALVKRGLDGRIQKALDVVRVVGNNAVHPGQIDLRDDKAIAIKLFDLVNLIVEAMVATPKHIESMYAALPDGALKAIEKRDGKDEV
jgi:hypothetical protein